MNLSLKRASTAPCEANGGDEPLLTKKYGSLGAIGPSFAGPKKWMGRSSRLVGPTNRVILETSWKAVHAERQNDVHDVEDAVAKNAINWAWRTNVITWFGFFILSVCSAFCEINYGIAKTFVGHNPGFVCVLAIWLLTTMVSLFCELKTALHILPAQASAFPGKVGLIHGKCSGLAFSIYLGILLFISFILHTDIFTTAMFVGRVFKSTHSCDPHWNSSWFFHSDENAPLEIIWKDSMKGSVLLGYFGLRSLTFWSWTCIAWIVMFSQFVYGFLYKTWCGLDVPGRCIQILGDSGRMMSVQWLDDYYKMFTVSTWPQKKVRSMMIRANIRFMLFGAQAIILTNLQITYAGASRQLMDGKMDFLTTISTLVSVIFAVKYISWEVKSLSMMRNFVNIRRNGALSGESIAISTDKDDEKALDIVCRIVCRINCVVSLVFSLMLVEIVIKLFMEMIWCKCGSFTFGHGCDDCSVPHGWTGNWTGNWALDQGCHTIFDFAATK